MTMITASQSDKAAITATLIDRMGTDLSVVNAARVSFGKSSEWAKCTRTLKDKDAKLIKYLAEHKHFSPFGHAFASFHVKAPIFVARQLVKHKFLRINEVSRRYVDDEPEFYVPEVWRGRSEDKKQGSSDTVITQVDVGCGVGECCHTDGSWMVDIVEHLEGHNLEFLEVYTRLIKSGVAPEQARMVLPQSTMTEWYWSGSLDAFADMCKLRCKEDTQYETRLVADQISEKMKELFPVSWIALLKP
jgi:thymidylate synthase (FAD)